MHLADLADTGPGGKAVPGVTVVTALALTAASAFALFFFVHHAGQQLRVGALVDLVGDELRGQLDQRFPPAPALHEDASLWSIAPSARPAST